MEKDFENWNKLKLQIDAEAGRPDFKEGQIWWTSVGKNIGVEIDGKNEYLKRPVYILKKFNRESFWALPITSKNKEGRFYHAYEKNGDTFTLVLSQLRILDAKRLRRKITTLSIGERNIIISKIVALLE